MRIMGRWSTDLDEVHDEFEDKFFYWSWPRWIRPKQRITKDQAIAAQNYINFIVKRLYPYQLRERMGRELWVEFCEYWSQNPDFDKSMRYL